MTGLTVACCTVCILQSYSIVYRHLTNKLEPYIGQLRILVARPIDSGSLSSTSVAV